MKGTSPVIEYTKLPDSLAVVDQRPLGTWMAWLEAVLAAVHAACTISCGRHSRSFSSLLWSRRPPSWRMVTSVTPEGGAGAFQAAAADSLPLSVLPWTALARQEKFIIWPFWAVPDAVAMADHLGLPLGGSVCMKPLSSLTRVCMGSEGAGGGTVGMGVLLGSVCAAWEGTGRCAGVPLVMREGTAGMLVGVKTPPTVGPTWPRVHLH